ncbi:flagellar motor switch protein FliN [Blastomonas aquatica]|uniref:Flagellar motor switch protein FliN n=2 Tax=Blastomonas aquatica TaxID=1510276 RepID=A0ABQ1JU84_9SPHN|nr:hypothetical protein GCM10010833_31950 [Blastomonas aquatica]
MEKPVNNQDMNDAAAIGLPEEPSTAPDFPVFGETALAVPFDDLASFDPAATMNDGLDAVNDVPLTMQAVLGRARMTISELVQMRPGRVVELDRKVGEPVDIYVNDRLIARGEVVLIDKVLGVTLTEIVREED